jgi:predicted dehydrogenase
VPVNSNKSMKRLKMGMIGGGPGSFIGEIHRIAARLDNKIDLVSGAFSSDFKKTEKIGEDLGLSASRLYKDYETMIKTEATLPKEDRMDFVVIVTPNHMHLPPALLALNTGFHVLSDKPATLNYNEVVVLKDAVEKSGLLYGLTHTYLGYPMVKQAKFMVKSGCLGKVRKILVEYPQGWLSQNIERSANNKQAEWRTDPARSGISGCMGDIGTHAHSLVEYISGNIMTQVCADLNIFVEGRMLDDDGSLLFRMDNGAKGVLTASQICAGEDNNLTIKIYGEKGGIEWCQHYPFNLIYRPIDLPEQILTAGVNKAYLCEEARKACRTPAGHPEGYLEAFANIYCEFVEAIMAFNNGIKTNEFIGIEEGVRGMAFLEAIIKSNKNTQQWANIQ